MIETKIKARATPCYCELENQNRALDGEFVKCCLCKIAEKELNIRDGLYETEKGTPISNLKKTERTKMAEYKYVHVNEFSCDLKKEFEAGELYYFLSAITHKYLKIDSEDDFINAFIDSNVFRRVELTEEDELIEVIKDLLDKWCANESNNPVPEYLAKSGKLKLA